MRLGWVETTEKTDFQPVISEMVEDRHIVTIDD